MILCVNLISVQKANELVNKYRVTSGQLDTKYNMTTQAQAKAQALRERANKIGADVQGKLGELKGKAVLRPSGKGQTK